MRRLARRLTRRLAPLALLTAGLVGACGEVHSDDVDAAPAALTVVVDGDGTVTSSPAGISCGSDCSESYPAGTSVTLTATAASGSSLTGWSGGGCSGAAPTCTVTVTGDLTVTATFAVSRHTLTVALAGTGSGTVTSAPPGITCGSDCSEAYAHGTPVTLSATPAPGSRFDGWSGGCSGATCALTMTAPVAVIATFGPCTIRTVDVYGSQHVSFNYAAPGEWRDSYFRAYESPPDYDLTGWVKFDLTAIPDDAQVSAASFHAYAQTVYNAPQVRMQYSTANDWQAATVLVTELPRSIPQVSSLLTPTQGAYATFPLTLLPGAVEAELADNFLTLGVDNAATTYSYAYFSGVADANPPYLRVTYCN